MKTTITTILAETSSEVSNEQAISSKKLKKPANNVICEFSTLPVSSSSILYECKLIYQNIRQIQ